MRSGPTGTTLERGPRPTAKAVAEAPAGPQPGPLAWELATGLVRRRADRAVVGAADDPVEGAADDLARTMLASGPASCGCAERPGETCHCGPPGGGDTIRRKPAGGPPGAVPPDLFLGGGQRLHETDRGFFEARTGMDLSGVRVHDDPRTAVAARGIEALAFTRGSDIGFAAGAYRPGTPAGQSLLAHELAHVISGHSGVRRMSEHAFDVAFERAEKRRLARERHHAAWVGGVEAHRLRQLPEQSRTIGAERERIGLALLAQRSAAIDAAAAGQGWLVAEMAARGYTGPGLAEVKQAWGNALVAAENLQLARPGEPPSADAKIVALEAVPVFYDVLSAFSAAAEGAHLAHATAENTRMRTQYEAALERYRQVERAHELTIKGTAGDLGSTGFRGGLALTRGAPPREPKYLTPPPAVSPRIASARAQLYAADSAEQWTGVVRDVESLAAGLSTLVISSLPESSEIRRGAEYLEQLGGRLAKFEEQHPTGVRVPAIFYPLDKIIQQPGAPANQPVVVESIPWQFYLINTRLTPAGQPLRPDGEWQLIDLTSARPQPFTNRAPASDEDTLRLQRGEKVDPPVDIFTELNSKLRFPEGLLHFMMPSGRTYVLETTEPWEWSDFFTAVGIALAAIALVAAVIATGGAAAPAAVAFYAGLGAAAAGIGSALAGLHEKNKQGILTGADVDQAMISIGIDLLGALSMGLSRLVALPAAAARIGLTGSRLVTLQQVALGTKVAVAAGDVYQAWSFTTTFLNALSALEDNKQLTDEERKRMRGQLVRRALLTGALLTVALKSDVGDVKDALRAGRTLRIARVDDDGSLVVRPDEPGLRPGESGAPSRQPTGTGDVAPHAQVAGPVHEAADRTGATMRIGPQSHGLGVAGEGRFRDLYFCSDACTPIVLRLEPIIGVLPWRHPLRKVFQDLLRRARGARQRLRAGKLTPEEADEIANQISADIARHSRLDGEFAALMNTDPALLRSRAGEARQLLARNMRAAQYPLAEQAGRQAAARGPGAGVDPVTGAPARREIELDILGGLGMEEVLRAGRRAQPLHFDTGIFSHTYAEALVPGLPRGLAKEVPITLPGGGAGRADRVRFIYDETGTVIGAHVYEIKPNTPDNMARGQVQADEYVAGLQTKIEADLRTAGKAIPTTAPDGGPLYATHVMPYDQQQMMAVLRAIRGAKADAAQMAHLERIARAVFEVPITMAASGGGGRVSAPRRVVSTSASSTTPKDVAGTSPSGSKLTVASKPPATGTGFQRPLAAPTAAPRQIDPSREAAKLPTRPKPGEPGPRTTHGRGVDADGREYQFSSSNQQDKELIAATNDRLRQRGYLPGRATSSRASDVEQKVATQMRLHGTERADLVINNADGPCRVRLGCDQSLPDLLDPGQKLTVHWQDASGVWQQKVYVGRP